MPFDFYLYQEAWGILLCTICEDGIKPNDRSFKSHLVDHHQLANNELPSSVTMFFAGDFHLETAGCVGGVATRDMQYPRPLPHLINRLSFACLDCGHLVRADKQHEAICHQTKSKHGAFIKVNSQTVYGNRQIRTSTDDRAYGRTVRWFPTASISSIPTPDTNSSTTDANNRSVTPEDLTSRDTKESILAAFNTSIVASTRAVHALPDPQDVRVAISKLGWERLTRDIDDSTISDLVRRPMTHLTTHRIPIEPRLFRLGPVVERWFEDAYTRSREQGGLLRRKAFVADHKHVNDLILKTRKSYASHMTRFIAFFLRKTSLPNILPIKWGMPIAINVAWGVRGLHTDSGVGGEKVKSSMHASMHIFW